MTASGTRTMPVVDLASAGTGDTSSAEAEDGGEDERAPDAGVEEDAGVLGDVVAGEAARVSEGAEAAGEA